MGWIQCSQSAKEQEQKGKNLGSFQYIRELWLSQIPKCLKGLRLKQNSNCLEGNDSNQNREGLLYLAQGRGARSIHTPERSMFLKSSFSREPSKVTKREYALAIEMFVRRTLQYSFNINSLHSRISLFIQLRWVQNEDGYESGSTSVSSFLPLLLSSLPSYLSSPSFSFPFPFFPPIICFLWNKYCIEDTEDNVPIHPQEFYKISNLDMKTSIGGNKESLEEADCCFQIQHG